MSGAVARDYGLDGPETTRAIERGLADARWFQPAIDPAVLRSLQVRTDGRAAVDRLKRQLAQLAEDLGRKDIHFVIGRLSDFDMENKRYQHWTKVREVQVELVEIDQRLHHSTLHMQLRTGQST